SLGQHIRRRTTRESVSGTSSGASTAPGVKVPHRGTWDAEAASRRDGNPMRVLMHPARSNAESNPYNLLLATALERIGTTVEEYSLRRSWRGQYDVYHVH